MIFLSTFLWGLGYPVLKVSYTYWNIANDDVVTKLLFAGIRFIVAGLLLIGCSSIKNKKLVRVSGKVGWQIAMLGLCQTVLQYGFLYIGLSKTSGTKSSVLNQFCVFLTVLLTPVFFKNEKFTVKKLIGCLIGFIGIICMNVSGLSLSFEIGDLLVLLASCATAAGYLISKSIPSSFDSFSCTGYQQFFGGLILTLIGLIFGGKLGCVSFMGLLLFVYLVFECAIAFSAWYSLMQNNDPAEITVFKFLTPVFGVLFSGLILNEKIFTINNILSLLLVSVGIVIVNSSNTRREKTCTDTY